MITPILGYYVHVELTHSNTAISGTVTHIEKRYGKQRGSSGTVNPLVSVNTGDKVEHVDSSFIVHQHKPKVYIEHSSTQCVRCTQ